jgi:hypothetical protein
LHMLEFLFLGPCFDAAARRLTVGQCQSKLASSS